MCTGDFEFPHHSVCTLNTGPGLASELFVMSRVILKSPSLENRIWNVHSHWWKGKLLVSNSAHTSSTQRRSTSQLLEHENKLIFDKGRSWILSQEFILLIRSSQALHLFFSSSRFCFSRGDLLELTVRLLLACSTTEVPSFQQSWGVHKSSSCDSWMLWSN